MSQMRPNQKASGIFQMILAAWKNISANMPPDRDLDRKLVRSSAVVAVGYKRASRTLQVEYFSGWVCEASGVPKEIYEKLMQAKDFDTVFRRHVLNQYPMDRIGRLVPVFGG